MVYKHNRRTKVYRRLAAPAGYRQPLFRPTPKAIGPVMNAELKALQAARKVAQS
jgi:hypothetical protein